MTQQEFYTLPEVITQLNIQRSNPYGSKAHKAAYNQIGELAKQYGVWREYKKAGGGIY